MYNEFRQSHEAFIFRANQSPRSETSWVFRKLRSFHQWRLKFILSFTTRCTRPCRDAGRGNKERSCVCRRSGGQAMAGSLDALGGGAGKMGAPLKRDDVPVITPHDLAEADWLIFGFPTRFGMTAAQFKAFLDSTGGLWRTMSNHFTI
uniref:NAD(P)H dehydrogenase (quinone) n=1 Tax=Kalanchoe fedtschenkoi TaxID=63787 RepID=A0A7N0RF62_KALFE